MTGAAPVTRRGSDAREEAALGFLILIVVAFLAFWLLVALTQRRRQHQLAAMLGALEPGDEALTAGGVLGFVRDVREDEVALEIADGVVVRVAKRAVAAVFEPSPATNGDGPSAEGAAAPPAGEEGRYPS